MQILDNLPKEYDVLVQMMKKDLSDRNLDIVKLYDKLEMRYKDLKKEKGAKKKR